MHRRADAANPLTKCPGVARIAAFENYLQAAHHRAGAPGINDFTILNLCFDAKMAFDTSDGINHDTSIHESKS